MDIREADDNAYNQNRCLGITDLTNRKLGKVKWYDAVKVFICIFICIIVQGFGFITDQEGEDIFVFLINILTNKEDTRRPVLISGEEVEFSVCQTRKGPDAREVSLPGGKPFPSYILLF